MNSALPGLLRNELVKTTRRKLPYFGVFAVAVISCVVHFVAVGLNNNTKSSAWGYLGFSMQMIFSDIGPICILAFVATLLSEETGTGTIRFALAVPVKRWEFFTAKAITGLLYAAVLSVVALLCSLAWATGLPFADVSDAFGVVYQRKEAAETLLAAFAFSWIPLGALVMYGLLISALVRNPGTAVATGIGVLYLIDFTKHLVGIDPYIFTRYLDFSWQMVQDQARGMDYRWLPEVWKMLALCGASALTAFLGGLIVFVREDLNH